MSEFKFYFFKGLEHVLDWNAYDHVLFLILLIVAYNFDSWKKIFSLVTLFTLGHTTALFLSSYNIISVNSRIVEFLIPLTILAAAIFNLFTAGKSHNGKIGILYGVTLFFGLIHGLGFARFFSMFNSSSSKALPLLEFALGIEAAQIIVVFLFLIISFIVQTIFRFSKRDWVMVISSIIIGLTIPMIVANKIW